MVFSNEGHLVDAEHQNMEEIDLESGIDRALDSLLSNRLALLCGAGLSMAPPSSLPSAAAIAQMAKEKYDATYGTDRQPLALSIDQQAEYFYNRNELSTVYLRSYVDPDAFSAEPNCGHFAVADLLLSGGITTAVSTNVDTLVETAANMLFGQVGIGVSRAQVAALPSGKAPYLKIHGCWSDPSGTIWAPGQVHGEPTRTRIQECGAWLEHQLLDKDIVIVGYWTDWDYLNEVLERALGAVRPARVIVVDPCDTADFPAKAPALFAVGRRAANEFTHVRCSGHRFLERLRVKFSRSFVRRVLHSGQELFCEQLGSAADPTWFEPPSDDATILWQIRRDLEGCYPNEPAKRLELSDEPLLGMTLLQLRARGAVAEGHYWNLDGARVRVLRTPNRPLHVVKAAFERETAPIIAPDVIIAVGAEQLSLQSSIARGSAAGSIARGASSQWLSRQEAVTELGL